MSRTNGGGKRLSVQSLMKLFSLWPAARIGLIMMDGSGRNRPGAPGRF